MRSTFGPLRTFVPALAKVREIGTAGRSAPRMSPESGCARLSSSISLRRAPHRPDPIRGRCSGVVVRRAASAGAAHERAGTNVGKRPSTDSRFMRLAQHDAGRSR